MLSLLEAEKKKFLTIVSCYMSTEKLFLLNFLFYLKYRFFNKPFNKIMQHFITYETLHFYNKNFLLKFLNFKKIQTFYIIEK